MKKNQIIRISLILILTVIFSESCSFSVTPVYKNNQEDEKLTIVADKDEYKNLAVKATEKLHKLLEEEKYEEIYQMVDENSAFKQDKNGFIENLKEINQELGKLQSIKATNGNVFQKTSGYEVRLEFLTKFEKDTELPKRFELVGWEIYPDQEAKLLFYTNAKGEDGE